MNQSNSLIRSTPGAKGEVTIAKKRVASREKLEG